jgi:hypothetical protein
MKRVVFLLVVLAIMAGCKQKTVSLADKVFTILEIDSTMAQYEDSVVIVAGTVDHICKHGGKKIVIMDADSNRIHIFAGEGGVSAFDATLVGADVKIWAKVVYDKIDEAYLNDWESRLAEQEAKYLAEMDTASNPGEIDMEHFESERAEIAEYRAQIAESAEGFIKEHYLMGVKIEEVLPEETAAKPE